MPRIYIDNQPYEVKAGKNMLESCLTLGFDLPYFAGTRHGKRWRLQAVRHEDV